MELRFAINAWCSEQEHIEFTVYVNDTPRDTANLQLSDIQAATAQASLTWEMLAWFIKREAKQHMKDNPSWTMPSLKAAIEAARIEI